MELWLDRPKLSMIPVASSTRRLEGRWKKRPGITPDTSRGHVCADRPWYAWYDFPRRAAKPWSHQGDRCYSTGVLRPKMEIPIKTVRRFSYSVLAVLAIASLASADTLTFSFSGGGITSSGTLTLVSAPDSTSGVSTPGTYEITGITGTFTDSNDGISGAIPASTHPFLTLRPSPKHPRALSALPPPACLTTICFFRGESRQPTARVSHSPVAISIFWAWPST